MDYHPITHDLVTHTASNAQQAGVVGKDDIAEAQL
jgi:hypothetical protein